MIGKILIVLLVALVLDFVHFSQTQQAAKVPRIGYLTGATPDGQSHRIEASCIPSRERGACRRKIHAAKISYSIS
jgi:hypothetical protein